MAVPGSGTLRLAGLAAEKDSQADYDDYDYDDVLSLKDITIGGNANGNHFSVDVTNTASTLHPNNTAPFAMSEFYSYDHDAVGLAMGNQKPQVFAYYFAPSPNNGQSTSTDSALGTVATIPASNQSLSGTSTKRGSFTSPTSSISTSSLNATVNAASTNSWVIPTSGTLHNGFDYGITYYTTMWAHSSNQNLTVLSGTTEWKFTGGLDIKTDSPTGTTNSITMNGNMTDNGLGTSPASGSTSNVTEKGFVYSTTVAAPTVGASGVSGSVINPSSSGFKDEGSYSITISASAGTYNIRAYARKVDVNTGPTTALSGYFYGQTNQYTIAAARTQYPTTIAFPKPNSVCGNYEDTSAKWYSTSPPAVNTVVYTSQTGNGKLAAGFYGYADGQLAANRKITVGANGVITAHSNC